MKRYRAATTDGRQPHVGVSEAIQHVSIERELNIIHEESITTKQVPRRKEHNVVITVQYNLDIDERHRKQKNSTMSRDENSLGLAA